MNLLKSQQICCNGAVFLALITIHTYLKTHKIKLSVREEQFLHLQ